MRIRLLAVLVLGGFFAACGGGSTTTDAGSGGGSGGGFVGVGGGGGDDDGGTGGGAGGGTGGGTGGGNGNAFDAGDSAAQIAAVRAATNPEDGGAEINDGGLSLDVSGAVITYVKPATPVDPAGFFIQGTQEGPALFIAVDPATLSPVPMPGDQVSLTVRSKAVVAGMVQVSEIASYTRLSTNNALAGLKKDMSNVSLDVPATLTENEHEYITVTGTIVGGWGGAGAGNNQARFSTAAIADGGTRLRSPAAQYAANADLLSVGCVITLDAAPLWRFDDLSQFSYWQTGDVRATSCPPPNVISAAAPSLTEVSVWFDRRLDPTTVNPNASQFSFDNGLTGSSAYSDGGLEVTIATSPQTGGAAYRVSVDSSVKDVVGGGINPARNDAGFFGYEPPAVLQITEVNPNISQPAQNRDLLELKVLTAGTVRGFTLVQRPAGTTFTFPAVTVAQGDVIVIHFGTNNQDPASETTAKNEFPVTTYTNNYDTAWDFYGPTTGLTFSNQVLSVRDALGAIQDVMVGTNINSPASFPAELQAMQSAGHWSPADCGGVPCTYTSTPTATEIGVSWSNVGTNRLSSIQRTGSTDTNAKADWTEVTGTASFGL